MGIGKQGRAWNTYPGLAAAGSSAGGGSNAVKGVWDTQELLNIVSLGTPLEVQIISS